ncbi:MAG: putative DNA binding domain-containing protein [Breznakibacter sp.]|nr:putative DNA binding domain-containing protein [Breznakibacter sp.]
MASNIVNLKELSQRESERVEWKESVADIDDIIRTAVAFANDFSNLGGGYIVCGAKETKDEHGFQKLVEIGLGSSRLKEIEGKFMNDLREKVFPPIVPLTEEIPVSDDKRILVFIIPASKDAHSYRGSGKDSSTYYVRIGRETREAKNGVLRELLIQKKEIEQWDKRLNPSSEIEDIDLLVLREYLQEMKVWDSNKALEDYISDKGRISSFVAPLAGREKITDKLKPKNFTLLMFSKDPMIFFPGAYTIFSIYKGKDRSEPTAERHEITGNIVQQARKCIELLNAETYTAFDKTDNIPNQLKYPLRALQEAIVNCLAHRDYEIDQPSRVTVFTDRIEIYSPGSLPRAIEKEKFLSGRATPYWRNQSLAYFFNKLQLAQAEGQGIPTILRLMREEGCPSPIFDIEPQSVTCVLPAHPRHSLIKEIHNIEKEIILGKHHQASLKLLDILKNDPFNFRVIDLLCEVSNILDKPDIVLTFLLESNISFEKLNANTITNIADVIAHVKDNAKLKEIADRLMTSAQTLSLEEKQLERLVVSMKRLSQNEELIGFVNNAIEKNLTLSKNIILLENRAKAKMDLAKICLDTGRNTVKYKNASIRSRALETAQRYLAEAERDLNAALENATSYVDRDHIEKDLDFLMKMKSFDQVSDVESKYRHQGVKKKGTKGK